MRKPLAALVLVTVSLLAGAAHANPIIMATGVDWGRGGSLWIREDSQDVQAYFAGVIFISLTTGGHVYNRDTLCVDLFTDIFLGTQYESTVWSPNQIPGKHLDRVGWLIDNVLQPTQSSNPQSLLPQADWVNSAAQGEALQFAIWDIVHDNGDGFSAGRVQAVTDPAHPTDPTVLAWAQTYEQVSLNESSVWAYIYENVDMGNGQQVQMLAGPRFFDGGPTPPPAPETKTLLLTGTALVAIGVFGKRKRQA